MKKDRVKRKYEKKEYKFNINIVILDLLLHNRKTPHGLIELSCKQWSRISHNSIFLDKICINFQDNGSKFITYESIDLGDGIKKKHEKGLSNKKQFTGNKYY